MLTETPDSQPTATSEITFEHIFRCWDAKLIGTVELRNWLANRDSAFAVARDRDIDDDIRQQAALNKHAAEQNQIGQVG